MFRKIISITTIILVILAYMPSVAFAEGPADQNSSAPSVTEETEPVSVPETETPDVPEADATDVSETEPAEDEGLTEELAISEAGMIRPVKASDSSVRTRSEAVMDTVISSGKSSKWNVGTEFMIIGLARNDNFSEAFAEQYCTNLVTLLDKNKSAKINENQASNNAKAVIALTSIGIDPTDVYGYNLLEPLSDMRYVTRQGINGIIWTLIAANSHGYDFPECEDADSQTTVDKLVGALLAGQKSDGGWTYSGSNSDVDMTGMALQALAPYYNKSGYEDVTAAINEALEWLSGVQDENGDFVTYGNVTSESASQVIVALCALGINPNTDERFVKNGKSAVDSLLSFYTQGGFKHVRSESGRNGLATIQGNYALTAYLRFIDGKTSLYDMSDIETLTKTNATPGKNNEDKPNNLAPGGKTLKLDLKLTSAAKDVIAMMKAAVANGSEETAKNAYRAYLDLSAAEKLAVRKDDVWKPYKELTSQFGQRNHFDEPTGVDLTYSTEKALPWYILLVVVEESLTTAQEDIITKQLGDPSAVLSTYDISFINTLTNQEWHPSKIVIVRLNMPDLGGLEDALIYHWGKGGKLEFLTSQVYDNAIEFSAIDFSIYGVAGMNGTISDMLTTVEEEAPAEENHSMLPWILALVAALALATLIILIFRRRREDDE